MWFCGRRCGGGHRFGLGLFAAAQGDGQRFGLAVAQHDHLGGLANFGVGDFADQFAGIGHLNTIKLGDDIARLHAGFPGRAFGNIRHQRAPGIGQPHGFGDVRRHILNAHAQPAAAGFPEFAQLIGDLRHDVRRHRKADADRSAVGRKDCGVHADHLTVHVEQRAPRIAPVDRGIGLDEIVIAAAERAVAGRNDACRHREALAKRVAHGHHPVAHPHQVTVAELHEGQRFVTFNLQQGDIGLGVGANQFGIQGFARIELDLDFVGPFDDVIVGHDIAIFGNHETRSQGLAPARLRIVALTVAVLEIPEEFFERRSGRHHGPVFDGCGNDGRGGDVHHRRADLRGKIGKRVGRAQRCRLDCRGDRQGQTQNGGGGKALRGIRPGDRQGVGLHSELLFRC